jgi:riboflavin kinase / FMN adenylyltransferase
MIIRLEKLSSGFFKNKNAAAVIGFFDGVHLGHQKIINLCIEKAKEINGISIVFTFDRPPQNIIRGSLHKKLILPYPERIKLIKSCGVDYIVIANFNPDFSKLEPEEFCRKILIEKLRIKELFIGHDFNFGHNAAGNAGFLKDFLGGYKIKVNIVPVLKIDGIPVSSTTIRKYYNEGNIEKIKEFLGREPELTGTVVSGESRGKQLGFPTANIDVFEKFVTPKDGVYTGLVSIVPLKTRHAAIINVGSNPTFKGTQKWIESYILDFDRDIYGKKIKVSFLKRIRDEKMFKSRGDLIEQLNLDLIFAKKYFLKVIV